MAASCSDVNIDFDDYWLTLDAATKARYREKVLCGFDPYKVKKGDYSEDFGLLPAVQYPDIVNYFVLQCSWETMKEMKAFMAIEAYNFFVSGWVNSLLVKKVTKSDVDAVVVYSRV